MCWRGQTGSLNRSPNGRTRQRQTRIFGRTHGHHPGDGSAVTKLLIEKGIITEAEFKAEAVRGACGVPANFASASRWLGLLYRAVREYRRSAMREIVFYYLLALNLVGGLWLVYAIIPPSYRTGENAVNGKESSRRGQRSSG
jgi:hypothetical protein